MESTEPEIIPKKENRALRLLKIMGLQFFLPIATFTVLVYLFVAPLVVHQLFPEYSIRDTYVDIKTCSESVEGQSQRFFQPQQCLSSEHTSSLSCVYEDTSYKAPKSANNDQTKVCPTLKPSIINGNENIAVPTFKVAEQTYRVLSTLVISFVVSSIYIIIRIVIFKRHSQKHS